MEAFCEYNPSDNPYWCNVIQGYCQFQVAQMVNEHCPIYYAAPAGGGGNVPYDLEVSYIQSTGLQWIDTGIPISGGGKRFVATFAFVGENAYGSGEIAGSENFIYDVRANGSDGYIFEQCTVNRITPAEGLGLDTTGDVFVEVESQTFSGNKSSKVDGTTVGTSQDESTVKIDGENYKIFIQSGYGDDSLMGSAKLKSFQIYDENGQLLFDAIPVQFTNGQGEDEGGLYDKVGKNLLENQGSGSFIIGRDVSDEFLQTHGFATIFDSNNRLISIGDTAFQKQCRKIRISVPYVRYIGKYAFQDCVNLMELDFSGKKDQYIPVLASPKAFMLEDGSDFVNDTFVIKVPSRLYDRWIQDTNWSALKNHIIGV